MGGKAMTVTVGLIGLGSISRAHLMGYERARDDAVVTAVCDVNPERATSVAGELGAKPFASSDELIQSGTVEAVDIMLPHHLHAEVALSALRAGLHVLLEKPGTRTLEELNSLQEEATKQGVAFAVAENTPFVAAYQVVEELVKAQSLGEVESVRTLNGGGPGSYKARTAPPSWWRRQAEALGGVIYDSATHPLYLMEWLFGGVADVLAVGSYRDYSEVDEFGVVVGKLSSGADYVMETVATGRLPWTERLEVYGSKASVIVDSLADPVVKVYSDEHDWNGTSRPDVPFRPFPELNSKSVADGVVDFFGSIKTGAPHRVNLEYVRATTLVLESVYESLNGGSRTITVDRSVL
jgi:predicted dehydrogenase